MWHPAVNGNPRHGHPPVLAGMHFHDLRHTHKPGSSKTTSPRSPKPDGSATAYPASAASTVQAHHVGDLGRERRIPGDLERALPVRLAFWAAPERPDATP